ncbi:MAG: hypothetical protein QNJ09_12945 [Paracoccaceae bacterium]|nr:hypothetical protein [Paracoccaceae bacterium]
MPARGIDRRVFLTGCLALAGCGVAPDASAVLSSGGAIAARAAKIDALAGRIIALRADVDPVEAQEVARIAVEEPLHWAQLWQVTDPPLIHNIKVNSGRRPRGLCKDWADDLEARMRAENFQTLSWHRAIANHDNMRIEHSTLIVSALGEDMYDGIVLDPWRQGGGRLFFESVLADAKYRWTPRQEVFAWKRARLARR